MGYRKETPIAVLVTPIGCNAEWSITLNIHDFTTEDIQRFWEKVNISDDPDACWELKNNQGYGTFLISALKKSVPSHRVSYILTHGEIPIGLIICHRCDNPRCVNPKHLYAGTHSDNMNDFNDRHREYVPVHKPDDKYSAQAVTKNRGESNNKAKLTWEKVREIRKLSKEGMRPKQLAELFNISMGRISAIIYNKAWIE